MVGYFCWHHYSHAISRQPPRHSARWWYSRRISIGAHHQHVITLTFGDFGGLTIGVTIINSCGRHRAVLLLNAKSLWRLLEEFSEQKRCSKCCEISLYWYFYCPRSRMQSLLWRFMHFLSQSFYTLHLPKKLLPSIHQRVIFGVINIYFITYIA